MSLSWRFLGTASPSAREAMFLKEQIEEQQMRKQMEKADKKNLGRSSRGFNVLQWEAL